MKRLLLQRLPAGEQGTPGVLFDGGQRVADTIELPWRWNVREISCIPAGIYPVVWSRSPRLRVHTFEILDVPSRAGIRLHSGNFAGDGVRGWTTHSLGCPLMGAGFGSLRNAAGRLQLAVLMSITALRQFETRMGVDPWELEVCDAA